MTTTTTTFSFEDFFPRYPPIDPIVDRSMPPILNAYDADTRFVDTIPTKREFASLKLKASGDDRTTNEPGRLLTHQVYISRFMSSHTGYDELLVYHEMGTGKTCTAIGVAENLRYEKNSFVKAAFVFAKGQGLINNFKQQLLFTCTDGRYVPASYASLTPMEKLVRSNKILAAFYTFYTFETFAKEAQKMTDEALARRFDNSVIVIDEVHNIRERIAASSKDGNRETLDDEGDDDANERGSVGRVRAKHRPVGGSEEEVDDEDTTTAEIGEQEEEEESRETTGDGDDDRPPPSKKIKKKDDDKTATPLDVYAAFYRLCHALKRRKILLMSGTPMRDGPEEFASIMNLILPPDARYPTGKRFLSRYVDAETSKIRTDERADLARRSNGRVTFLRAIQIASNVARKSLEGVSGVGSLRHFVVYPLVMEPFQAGAYSRAVGRDALERGLYANSRQASLMVFPDETYGSRAYNNEAYVRKSIGGGGRSAAMRFAPGDELRVAIGVGSMGERLANLARMSAKYAFRIGRLLSSERPKTFVYNQFVTGSGLIAFACVLECFGFVASNGKERTKARRYALVTNTTASTREMRDVIDRFNADDNVDGEYVQILLGSRVMNEGFTLKNVDEEDIDTPHWNYAETAQAIARGWRTGSHDVKFARRHRERDVTVKVFQLVSVLAPNAVSGSDDDEIAKSIDAYMYAKAERKDVTIKSVERVIKESSFDCPLTIDVNRSMATASDGDRECDYDVCAYACDGGIGRPLEESTYNLYYSADARSVSDVRAVVQNMFRASSIVRVDDVANNLPDFDGYELLNALARLSYDNVPFRDRYGFPCVLRVLDSYSIYASRDARYRSVRYSRWEKYYVEHGVVPDPKPSFDRLVTDTTYAAGPAIVETIFDNPRYARSLVVKLPSLWQRILLEQSLIGTEEMTTRHGGESKRQIVDMFKSFHAIVDGTLTVWAFANELGTARRYDRDVDDWVDAPVPETFLLERRNRFVGSPYGYYGLRNPSSDAFCLRDVREAIEERGDLRKLTVGKRCNDWKHGQLVDIAARNLKMDVPAATTVDRLTDEQVRARVTENRKARGEMVVSGSEDVDTLRRLAYWSGKNREQICAAMKVWFGERDLVDDSFSCGHQMKRRAEFR